MNVVLLLLCLIGIGYEVRLLRRAMRRKSRSWLNRALKFVCVIGIIALTYGAIYSIYLILA